MAALALALAGVGLVAVLAYPLPRNVGQVEAVIRTEPVGERVVVEWSCTRRTPPATPAPSR